METIENIYNTNHLDIRAEKGSECRKVVIAQNILREDIYDPKEPWLHRTNFEWDRSGKQHSVTMDVVAESGSSLELHLFNKMDYAGVAKFDINVSVQDNCNVTISVVSLDGHQVDTNINVNILGENSTVNLPGLLLPTDGENLTYHSTVIHQAGRSTTTQKVRTVADGNGFGDFFGIIKVQPDAQKSVTEQVNNNILLSTDARIESKPQLEIYADDVKCSHGSTTGMLDQDAIFYMRSRGISEKTAQNLLLQSFIDEVIDNICEEPQYKEFLKKEIANKFGMEL